MAHKWGVRLYKQQKYEEAEEVLRQAIHGRKDELGEEHPDTLISMHYLGRALHRKRKHQEAEEVLRQASKGRENVLGEKDVDTIHSKYYLGCMLSSQEKYQEAEEWLRQAAQGREEVLGKKDPTTLASKDSLGYGLYKQKKYEEAEKVSREAAQGREKALSKNHAATLASKSCLFLVLCGLSRLQDAEKVLRQVVQGQEKVLGSHSQDLDSDSEVARASTSNLPDHLSNSFPTGSHSQGLCNDSTIARTSTNAPPKHLSDSVRDFCPAGGESQGLHSDSEVARASTSNLPNHPSNSFPAGSHSRGLYSDSEIARISSVLKHLNQQWAKVPRTYIVLRTINCLDYLDDFIDLGFSDHWLPVTERRLPQYLRPSPRTAFVNAQHLVLTKSMDLERGERGQHCYFQRDDRLPFDTKGVLGSGGFGQVDRVLSLISLKEYARKSVTRGNAFGTWGTEKVTSLIADFQILKRLKHGHVVEFVGSYTHPRHICLIMSPVAEMDLSTYLKRADTSRHGELRTSFGCLARALEFLHEENVRHKDIKPGNILVDRGKVLFTDFGLSFDFVDENGSTSIGMVKGITPRYCAPEVAMMEPQNTWSDIWSLGVVFLEMIVVLKERGSIISMSSSGSMGP
ncbi:hypothetical protein LTR66_000320 [Elasticomyces elasticus]|nr:hypothetical protein LTR66_000320 [Elasticomyces elasticus]